MNLYGIINEREGKILLESEVIKNNEYKWLKDLLEKDKKHMIKKEVLKELKEEQRTFFESSLYNDLYEVASNEWKIEGVDDTDEKLNCSLCGQKDTKKIFYKK